MTRILYLFLFTLVIPSVSFAQSVPSNGGLNWQYKSAKGSKSKTKKRQGVTRATAEKVLTANFKLDTQVFRDANHAQINLGGALKPVLRDRLIAKNDDAYVWLGHVEDEPETSIAFYVHGNVVVGQIASSEGNFEVKSRKNGTFSLVPVETVGVEPCAISPEVTEDPDLTLSESDLTYSPSVFDDPVIRILVVYTEEALRGAAPWWNNLNEEYIEGEIELQIELLNQALQYSWTDASVELAQAVQVDLEEDMWSIYAYRSWVQSEMVTSGTEVHTLRQDHKADLVSLWVEDGVGYCGVAYIGSRAARDSPDYGVSVTDRSCHFKFTFSHEVGHNLGLRHDYYADDTMDPYTYGHGWVGVNAESRTMMAYDDVCEVLGIDCPRINRFSNPDREFWNGDPMGHSYVADNAAVIDDRWQRVANYRRSALTWVITPW
jgi:hypothetical protein